MNGAAGKQQPFRNRPEPGKSRNAVGYPRWRRAEKAVRGQKKRGRKPRVVEPTPPGEAKANVTDPDSRVMKTRQGYLQGYNVQAVVSEDQIIVAVAVTQEANDVHQLLPTLERMNQNLAAAGIAERPGVGLADVGYWSEANLLACNRPDLPELLVATTKNWKQRKAARERGCPRGRIPKELGLREGRGRTPTVQRYVRNVCAKSSPTVCLPTPCGFKIPAARASGREP